MTWFRPTVAAGASDDLENTDVPGTVGLFIEAMWEASWHYADDPIGVVTNFLSKPHAWRDEWDAWKAAGMPMDYEDKPGWDRFTKAVERKRFPWMEDEDEG